MGLKSFFRTYHISISLLAIVLLAIVLRLYHLDYQSLWVDEIASMNGTDPGLPLSSVIAYSKFEQPPLHFILLHYWFKLVQFNDFNGRLLALIFAILGIVAIFSLAREVRDQKAGLAAALITSLSYLHIFLSRDVRFYTLLFALTALSYLFYVRAVKSTKVFDFIFYSFFTTLMVYTHYYGWIVFASQGILFFLLVLLYPVKKRFLVSSVLSGLFVVLLISLWVPVLLSDTRIQNWWVQLESFYWPIKFFYVYFKDVFSSVAFASILLFYLLTLYRTFRLNGAIDRTDFLLLGCTVLSFLIPLTYSFIAQPIFHVRYSIIALPTLIVLIATGLRLLKPSLQRIVLITSCCTTLFSLIMIEEFYVRLTNEDWRGMIKGVIESAAPTDVFLSDKEWYCNYYFKNFDSSYRAIFPSQLDLDKQKPAGVWFLEGFDVSPLDSAEVTLLKNGYVRKKTDSLYRARATYYFLPP